MGDRAIQDNSEQRGIAPSNFEASNALRPSLNDMKQNFHVFKTHAAANDEPSELLFSNPFDSDMKWLGHVSNVPEVTRGLQSWDDVQKLGQGIFGGPLEYLSNKNSLNDSMLQLGPILDTAVNYYGKKLHDADGQGLANDAQSFGNAIVHGTAEAADELQQPLSQAEIGTCAAAVAPLFLLGRGGNMIKFGPDSGIELTTATGNTTESIWTKGWSTRGFEAEGEMGNSGILSRNFPTVDDGIFKDGVFTSMKSIDLNAPTYQNMEKLERTLNRYLDKMSDWEGQKKPWGAIAIPPSEIQEKVLNLGIPTGSMTAEQAKVFEEVAKRAQELGVKVKLTVIE